MSVDRYGFRTGIGGVHQSRTIMLADLQLLLSEIPAQATTLEYKSKIIDQNLLGKPTLKARTLAFQHLKDLYALDPQIPIFREMRRLWDIEESAQPFLALCCALARDPFLRLSVDFILQKLPGETVSRKETEELIRQKHPGKLSPGCIKSCAQTINGTWTQAGFLSGKAKKLRVVPTIHPVGVAYALFLGWLEGYSGQLLLTSVWARLCSPSQQDFENMAFNAAKRGLFIFRKVGEIVDIRFDGWLTEQESEMRDVKN